MKFSDICNNDSRRDAILNLSHRLKVARDEEEAADALAREASMRRMKIEQELCEIVRVVCIGCDAQIDSVTVNQEEEPNEVHGTRDARGG